MKFCRIIAIILTTTIVTPIYSQITIGIDKSEVIKRLGEPTAEYYDGDLEVLWYLDNYRITLERGIVASTRGSLRSQLPQMSIQGTFTLSYTTSLGEIAQLTRAIYGNRQIIHCSIPNSRFNRSTIETMTGTNATFLILRYSNDVAYTTVCFSNYFHKPGPSPNAVGVNSSSWSDGRQHIGGMSDYGYYEFGCMWFPDGREYIGEFNNGCPTGFGVTISNSAAMFRRYWPPCK